MTQEEKAQAYDEALEKAKIEINTKGIGETVDLCKQLFPELFESEDENLKNKSGYYKAGKFWKASTLWNATKNKIPQRVSNRYILQECTWNIGNLQDFANEVKNVQEVSLDYPIILDMNGNIIDGAHRVVKAYLEGKDIDIVYIGDDEWPEPDYDEEKAVKESDDERIKKSLIKFLTDIKEISESGRTTWAVRKEDAEMCKSFIAWLEKQKEPENVSASTMIPSCWEVKQKEQKPVEWSEEDEGELQNAIDALEFLGKKGVYRSESGYDAALQAASWLKSLSERFNLQRKVEWSDEDKRMLNHLIDKIQENWHIRMPGGHYFGITNDEKETFSSWLRYLPERFNLSPKQEWSGEDEKMIESICRSINEESIAEGLKCHGKSYSINELSKLQIKMTNFLKSINQKLNSSSWKPSEEQMEVLQRASMNEYLSAEQFDILFSFYEQLKKLV